MLAPTSPGAVPDSPFPRRHRSGGSVRRAQRPRPDVPAAPRPRGDDSPRDPRPGGGLTIRKIEQYDLGYEFDTLRRSIYVPSFRNSVLDIFEVFDMANPNLVIGNRTPSVLPTQSLFMMNSPFVIKLARETVASHSMAVTEDPTPVVNVLYRNILGRHPEAEELKLAVAYLKSFDGKQTTAAESLCHSLFASIDFRTLY